MTDITAAALDFLDGVPDDAPIDPAMRSLVLGLAAAVVTDPTNAALWREYRAALATIREALADVDDDDTAAFMVTVSSPRRAALRDASDL